MACSLHAVYECSQPPTAGLLPVHCASSTALTCLQVPPSPPYYRFTTPLSRIQTGQLPNCSAVPLSDEDALLQLRSSLR